MSSEDEFDAIPDDFEGFDFDSIPDLAVISNSACHHVLVQLFISLLL
jgi:hypothetical protein